MNEHRLGAYPQGPESSKRTGRKERITPMSVRQRLWGPEGREARPVV